MKTLFIKIEVFPTNIKIKKILYMWPGRIWEIQIAQRTVALCIKILKYRCYVHLPTNNCGVLLGKL